MIPAASSRDKQRDEFDTDQAFEHLFTRTYSQLVRAGAFMLSREQRLCYESPHGLVHEAYERLAKLEMIRWREESQMTAIATQMMRCLLIDKVRSQRRVKRGAGWQRISAEPDQVAFNSGPDPETEVAVREILQRIREQDPISALIIEMHFFVGFSCTEIAERLQLGARTVARRRSEARHLVESVA